ncbi:MAG: HAD family hydrolase [Deltaproteobacteria bacterium]|nr:HAD family hydrolase [Deltaproteobacteria bacterium]
MKRIRVVAFDCDGVMFDTETVNKAYYNQILQHVNKPALTPDQFAFVHMHTSDEAISYLFPGKAEADEANAYRKQMPYLPFLEKMEIEPYLKPLLRRLRPAYPTAIATNRTNTIQTVLEAHGLTDLFDLVVSAWDVDHPKPYPDPLNKIVRHFDIEPDELLYIGDSELDQIAAEAAGAILVAYKNPALRSDFHITSLKEMEQILKL